MPKLSAQVTAENMMLFDNFDSGPVMKSQMLVLVQASTVQLAPCLPLPPPLQDVYIYRERIS